MDEFDFVPRMFGLGDRLDELKAKKQYADRMVSKNQNIIDQFINVIEMIDGH